jgi:glutathione S-transferase
MAILDVSPPALLSLRYSPWSERARWALDHHGLVYRLVQHEPFLGERRLRKLVGPRVERPTVPVLVAPGEVLRDSWDIARYADTLGGADKLIPAALEGAIRELAELAERTMVETRGLVTAALLASNGALDENAPRSVPKALRPLFRPLVRYGTHWFARKYTLELSDLETQRRTLARTLATFRERYGDRPYLFERFSYGDILFCSLLQAVKPVDDRYIRLGPAERIVWTQPALAEEFSDLIRRRDDLYAAHRGSRKKPQ